MIAEDEDPYGFDWLPDGMLRVKFIGGPKDGELGEVDLFTLEDAMKDNLSKPFSVCPSSQEGRTLITRHAVYKRVPISEKSVEYHFTGMYVNNCGEVIVDALRG